MARHARLPLNFRFQQIGGRLNVSEQQIPRSAQGELSVRICVFIARDRPQK
jgi:hypothetical protein